MFAFELATARVPSDNEISELLGAYKDHIGHYQMHQQEAQKLVSVGTPKEDPPLDPVKLATWTMIANLILNLDEVLTKG